MSAPVYEAPEGRLVVRIASPLPDAARRHPLATRDGVLLVARIAMADRHWRPLTRKQRAALRRGLHDALAALPDDVQDGTEVPLPELPADTHPATRRALERKGLAAGGRLTPLAVDVTTWTSDRRPIATATATGGLL